MIRAGLLVVAALVTGCGINPINPIKASAPLACDPAVAGQLAITYTDWPAWLDLSIASAQSEAVADELVYHLQLQLGRYQVTDNEQAAPAVALQNAITAINRQRGSIYTPYRQLNTDELRLYKESARYYTKQLIGWLASQGCAVAPAPLQALGANYAG